MTGFSPFSFRYYNYYNRRHYDNYNNYPRPPVSSSIPVINHSEKVLSGNLQSFDDVPKDECMEKTRKSSAHNSFANINLSNLFSSNLDEPILEIMGIKLYSDDLLIISLLFFLYTEGVKDEILFICLILLLLG